MRVAVLTISDATSRGERADGSGDAAAAWVSTIGGTVAARAVVSDDVVPIVQQLLVWCDGDVADLVLTTGGTGLSPRDVTPEATRAALDREAPGIAERLRAVTGAASYSGGSCDAAAGAVAAAASSGSLSSRAGGIPPASHPSGSSAYPSHGDSADGVSGRDSLRHQGSAAGLSGTLLCP